eukprot:gene57624-biopygen51214
MCSEMLRYSDIVSDSCTRHVIPLRYGWGLALCGEGVVSLSTCAATGTLSDTEIFAPCADDDGCRTTGSTSLAQCDVWISGCVTLDIGAHGLRTGSSTLSIGGCASGAPAAAGVTGTSNSQSCTGGRCVYFSNIQGVARRDRYTGIRPDCMEYCRGQPNAHVFLYSRVQRWCWCSAYNSARELKEFAVRDHGFIDNDDARCSICDIVELTAQPTGSPRTRPCTAGLCVRYEILRDTIVDGKAQGSGPSTRDQCIQYCAGQPGASVFQYSRQLRWCLCSAYSSAVALKDFAQRSDGFDTTNGVFCSSVSPLTGSGKQVANKGQGDKVVNRSCTLHHV